VLVDSHCPMETVLEAVQVVQDQSTGYVHAQVASSSTDHASMPVPQALPESQTNADDASLHVLNVQVQQLSAQTVWILLH
jgi:hypothetical protein